MRNITLKKLFTLSLAIGLFLPGSLTLAETNQLTGDVRVTVSPVNIHDNLPIPGAERRVTMSLRGLDVTDALRALAKKGGFNVLIDESVKGTISVDLNDITIQQALETLKTYADLAYSVQGDNLMVADATSEKGKAFKKTATRIISLHYANASTMAALLNRTVFADRVVAASGSGGSAGGSGGSTGPMPVTADPQTNSLIVLGTPADIKTAQEHVAALDRPRQSRTWRLSQANVLDVATLLSASLFNEGIPVLTIGSGSSSGTASGGKPSTMPVVAEKLEEGEGTSDSSQSGGDSGSDTSLVNSLTLRAHIKEMQTAQISPDGPILIPDTRLNALTLLGTAQQIAMAETLIPSLDRKAPQVSLEASLIEISEDGRKELGFNNGFNLGHLSFGTNNIASYNNVADIGRINDSGSAMENILRYTANPVKRNREFMYQINALLHNNKARMLANPTVVTTSDHETVIGITDEIVRSVTVTTGTGAAAPTYTINIGEAGIVLNIMPRIGADGTINLRVRPLVSTVLGQEQAFGNIVTLLSKRELITQNTVLKDGETFVMGGLLQDTNTDLVSRTPGLASLPIVGALARNSTLRKHRTELVVVITPHILNDESNVTRYAKVPGSQLMPSSIAQMKRDAASSNDGMVPVSLNGASKSKPGYLPALEPVNVIDEQKSGVQGLSQPSPARLTPRSAVSSAETAPRLDIVRPAATSAAGPGNVSTGHTISDEEIRAIMNKFK